MDDKALILAQSIFYWLNYNNTVSKTYILLESSVRFPLAECLERRIGAKVELEVDHLLYSGLKVDFRYTLNNKSHYIELKFLHDYSNSTQEQKRYFDDLVRLAILGGNNYFILCGSREYLENRIKRYLPAVKSPDEIQKPRTPKDTVYPHWLNFIDINSDHRFIPTEFYNYVGSQKHETDAERQIPSWMSEIRTVLIAKQDDESKGSQVVYVWKVEGIFVKANTKE